MKEERKEEEGTGQILTLPLFLQPSHLAQGLLLAPLYFLALRYSQYKGAGSIFRIRHGYLPQGRGPAQHSEERELCPWLTCLLHRWKPKAPVTTRNSEKVLRIRRRKRWSPLRSPESLLALWAPMKKAQD